MVKYLSEHTTEHPEIEEKVVEFLKDPETNISPYVEMQLIRMLANAITISDDTYSAIWQILFSPGSDPISREFAARAVGRHVQPKRSAELQLLRGLFDHCHERSLRRALLVALKEGGDASKAFLGGVAKGDPDLKYVCEYLRGNKGIPPP